MIIERGGKVYVLPVTDTKAKNILPIMREKVNPGTRVFTDEWVSYKTLSKDYSHEVVNHGANEFVRAKSIQII